MKRVLYITFVLILAGIVICLFFSAYSCEDNLKTETADASAVTGWLELPAMSPEAGLEFLSHDRIHDGKAMRDWSCLYDSVSRVSHWVAYPLNEGLIGEGKRTDAWGLDPKVSVERQPVLYRGFKSSDPERRYDRGHQLPSADRLDRSSNVRTFYFTNMTPQLSQLNQKGWAQLEDLVRDRAMTVDTLYVVTGCTVDGAPEYAFDNEGRKVRVPSAYYKALLSYKVTHEGPEYKACGFWVEHAPFSGNLMEKAVTIDELELKTGMDFFVNLKGRIGLKAAEAVEATIDEWYYDNK